jgi:hypothetical protein
MVCVSFNNHFSCVIPPCFVSNNVTVLEHNASKWRWFFVVGSMMLFVVKLASAKYLQFNILTDDAPKVRVRNLCQTHINIDSRISKKTHLLAENCRQFVDQNKPRQGCWLQWIIGLRTGVGVRCSIVMFDFFMLRVVTIWWHVCTACGFVRMHEFGWIGDKGNVNVFWLSFFGFCAVRNNKALSETTSTCRKQHSFVSKFIHSREEHL